VPQPERFHNRLASSAAIVTGAGSVGQGVGNGKAIAALFAAEGARVCLVDLDRSRAEQSLELIASLGGTAHVVCGDVADGPDAARIVAECVEWLGRVDILVNNVGIAEGAGQLHLIPESEIERVMRTNLGSALAMTRYAIPHLLAGRGKAIVNIGSIAGMRAHGSAGYGPSKAAMIQLTAELAVMYGRDGIRANAVIPGHIVTPMVAAHLGGDMRRLRREIAPLDIEGDAWDVAQAALFLAGPESRFITGVALPVDGGVTQIGPLVAVGRVRGR
jgi:NAD(P)-dependent dehydrogenase (short-subunit alcohol dehydrogenase family)